MSREANCQFTGWHRVSARQPWVAICHGHDAATTLDRLLNATTRGDRAVLPVGRDPNNKQPEALTPLTSPCRWPHKDIDTAK